MVAAVRRNVTNKPKAREIMNLFNIYVGDMIIRCFTGNQTLPTRAFFKVGKLLSPIDNMKLKLYIE